MTTPQSSTSPPCLRLVDDDLASDPAAVELVHTLLGASSQGPEVRLTIQVTLVDQPHPVAAVAHGRWPQPVDAVEQRTPPARIDIGMLSERQREILELAREGKTNSEIAQALFLSVSTVERHCTIAYRALGVRNRAEALSMMSLSEVPAAHRPR